MKEGLTWEPALYKESPVLAMLCEKSLRAKLSILKSGQDRLTLQATLSHCESVKCLDNRDRDSLLTGQAKVPTTNKNMKVTWQIGSNRTEYRTLTRDWQAGRK